MSSVLRYYQDNLSCWAGFKATPANLLTVPVYVFACTITCVVGFLADRWGQRGYFNMWANHFLTFESELNVRASVFLCLGENIYIWAYSNLVWCALDTGAAGYIILVVSRNAALSYFAVFLATWCVVIPICSPLSANSWLLNNQRHLSSRSWVYPDFLNLPYPHDLYIFPASQHDVSNPNFRRNARLIILLQCMGIEQCRRIL